MRIDAHQHFWDVSRFEYSWMPPSPSVLGRSYLPSHVKPILERNRFDGCVAVEANALLEETYWLLSLAADYDFIKAVVGWVDLADPSVGDTLDQLQKHPKFKGVRHPVQDEPDDGWLVREDVLRGLAELARRGIPYDLLMYPRHLRRVPQIVERVPGLRVVIDHIAKPPIASGSLDPWATDISAAAKCPNVWSKLSGMITEADDNWKAADLRPYVSHVLECFGFDRLMFGSDWPVCLTAGTWKEVLAAFTQAIGAQPVGLREKLLGLNACEFYGIGR